MKNKEKERKKRKEKERKGKKRKEKERKGKKRKEKERKGKKRKKRKRRRKKKEKEGGKRRKRKRKRKMFAVFLHCTAVLNCVRATHGLPADRAPVYRGCPCRDPLGCPLIPRQDGIRDKAPTLWLLLCCCNC